MQAPRAWNKHLADKLGTAGWIRSLAEPSLWTLLKSESTVVAALVCFVDDVLIASSYVTLAYSLIADSLL